MIRLDRSPPSRSRRRWERGSCAASSGSAGAPRRRSRATTAPARWTPAAIEALRKLKRRRVPICVDSRYNLRAYTGLTMVKPNEVELEAASGVPLGRPNGLEKAARVLLRKVDCDVLS